MAVANGLVNHNTWDTGHWEVKGGEKILLWVSWGVIWLPILCDRISLYHLLFGLLIRYKWPMFYHEFFWSKWQISIQWTLSRFFAHQLRLFLGVVTLLEETATVVQFLGLFQESYLVSFFLVHCNHGLNILITRILLLSLRLHPICKFNFLNFYLPDFLGNKIFKNFLLTSDIFWEILGWSRHIMDVTLEGWEILLSCRRCIIFFNSYFLVNEIRRHRSFFHFSMLLKHQLIVIFVLAETSVENFFRHRGGFCVNRGENGAGFYILFLRRILKFRIML